MLLPFTLLSSCATTVQSRSSEAISFKPDVVRLDIDMADFELLGDVEISVEYRSYLGFITSIDKVNGEVYDRHSKQLLNVSHLSFKYEGKLSKSLYKVIETYPDADYIMPLYTKTTRKNLFLGSSVTKTAKFKAYKFKH